MRPHRRVTLRCSWERAVAPERLRPRLSLAGRSATPSRSRCVCPHRRRATRFALRTSRSAARGWRTVTLTTTPTSPPHSTTSLHHPLLRRRHHLLSRRRPLHHPLRHPLPPRHLHPRRLHLPRHPCHLPKAVRSALPSITSLQPCTTIAVASLLAAPIAAPIRSTP